jgi:signal transduction histidine kinase
MAYEQSDRLRRLIEQLLDLSRLDARSIPVSPRPIVVGGVLESIVFDAVPDGPDVELEVPEDLAAVADPVVLERILTNLLTNAVRHGRAPIRVSASRGDTTLRISVEDAGDGVAEELRDSLFDRFTRSESGIGSGLGLAIARAYAHALGGELFYRGNDPGACFELVIPQD